MGKITKNNNNNVDVVDEKQKKKKQQSKMRVQRSNCYTISELMKQVEVMDACIEESVNELNSLLDAKHKNILTLNINSKKQEIKNRKNYRKVLMGVVKRYKTPIYTENQQTTPGQGVQS